MAVAITQWVTHKIIIMSHQLTSTTDVPGGSSVNSMPCKWPWLTNTSLRSSPDTFGTGTTCKKKINQPVLQICTVFIQIKAGLI